MLDLLDYGVLFVNDLLHVNFMNACARELCLQNDGLSVSHERLLVSMPHEVIALQEIIKRKASSLPGEEAVMKVSRRSLRRPFEIVVIPGMAPDRQTHASMLLVFDPDKRSKVRAELISQLYGLTSAESRLVLILLQGKTLDEASSMLHRAKETVASNCKAFSTRPTHPGKANCCDCCSRGRPPCASSAVKRGPRAPRIAHRARNFILALKFLPTWGMTPRAP